MGTVSATAERTGFPVRAHVILRSDDRILLTLRAARMAGGGFWQLPGGHLEPGETIVECALREAREEIGVCLTAEQIAFVHVSHVLTGRGESRVAMFFEARAWQGEPVNLEPELCDRIGFFPIDALPRPTVPYIAEAIEHCRRGEPFAVSAGGQAVSRARA
ncbi:8-oxo-dGTP diphosphatase [Catenulispora sp. MAP12-49]